MSGLIIWTLSRQPPAFASIPFNCREYIFENIVPLFPFPVYFFTVRERTHARTYIYTYIHTHIHTHTHTHRMREREREREILARYKCLTYQRTSYMVCTSMAAIWITQICAVVEINPRRPIQCESNKCPARPDIVELSTLRTDIETESINGSKSIPKLSISAAAWRMLAQSSSRILFSICGQRESENTTKRHQTR